MSEFETHQDPSAEKYKSTRVDIDSDEAWDMDALRAEVYGDEQRARGEAIRRGAQVFAAMRLNESISNSSEMSDVALAQLEVTIDADRKGTPDGENPWVDAVRVARRLDGKQ